MHIRSLIFLGLCAAIGMSAPAFSEAPAKTYLFSSKAAKAAEAEAKAAEQAPKKKLTAKEKARQKALAKAKANEEAKLAAAAKAEEKARTAAKAKAAEEKKVAKLKAVEAKQLAARAKADAAAQRKLAKAQAAEKVRQAELAQLTSHEVARTGNNGELRSEAVAQPQPGFFQALFGGAPQSRMLPQTRALDAVLEQKQANRKFRVKSDFEPQSVAFSGYSRGTIVIDTSSRYLYLVESSSSARRYAIAVGREGLEFKGTAKVGDKQEWPRWIPTIDMQKREPRKYGQYKDGMPGGPENPLGARAIYLYQGKKDTHIRIHGTNQPQTIGTNSSNGCFRMVNDHVMDLYGRVKVGTQVVVM
ncbi:L,D-transpeptidase [Mesorhizobium sp. AaZ16]|uniref:L,D-transpeptidase n=1 Tax=Mesorhizobium sp. AaZ16 TaxID=3402289 RepID=UPI00374E8BAB